MTSAGNPGQPENTRAAHRLDRPIVNSLQSPRRPSILALIAALVALCACHIAAAQTTYSYRGQNFTLFSCGPSSGGGVSDCSNPAPGQSTYTASDYVFASLTLSQPLPPNLNLQSVSSLPGFLLIMSDGQQTLHSTDANVSAVAEVSTDANGNIIAPWQVQIYGTTGIDNGIATQDIPSEGFDADTADTSLTQTSGDTALNFGEPGAWFGVRSGTATWFYLEGSSFGFPFGPYSAITGSDGLPWSNQFNMVTPGGWTWAQSEIGGKNLLSAGAYAASSGPCEGGSGGCDSAIAAARGLAYETFTNTGPAVSLRMNAALEGGFINSSGGQANAAVYVVDATQFANSVPTGAAAANYLLGNSSIEAVESGSLALNSLFSEVLGTSTTTEPATAGAAVSVPVVTGLFNIGAGESLTVIFDVTAYAPPGTIGGGPAVVNFADTLAPAAVMFTDQNGNPVTQIQAVGPAPYTPPVPARLTLSPAGASDQEGVPAAVTVTATDSNGNLVPNAQVQLTIVSGPNASALTGPISTNSSGQAIFTDAGNGGVGIDTIQATAGSVTSNSATITWTTPGPLDHIVITPAGAAIPVTGSQSYDTQAYDKFNNLIGDVTASTSFAIAPDGSCTGATCTPANPGPHTVTATYSGDTAQASLTVNAVQASQTITFTGLPATATYGAAGPYTLNASASSGLPVTLSVSGPATLSGTTLTITGAGTVSVTASQAGNSNYAAATPVTLTLKVAQAGQTITFATIPTPTAGGTLALTATASSGLAVSYASTTTTVCTVSGSTATFLIAGTCTLTAGQAGNTNYTAATSVTQSFTVQAASTGGATFTITPLPATETISRGVLAAFILELNSVKGFNGNVTLSCSGGPSKSICADLPQTVKVNGVALAISGILFPANSTPGTYTITFTGTSGSLTSSTTARFTVK